MSGASHIEANENIVKLIFMHEQDYVEALKHTNAGGTMEMHALNVQIYLKMCRSDYAEKQLKIMQQIDEDIHTLTQLANAWFNLSAGGCKIQEAYLIYQDFSEKYPMTGKAVCCMHMGNFDEAESYLLDALNKLTSPSTSILFDNSKQRNLINLHLNHKFFLIESIWTILNRQENRIEELHLNLYQYLAAVLCSTHLKLIKQQEEHSAVAYIKRKNLTNARTYVASSSFQSSTDIFFFSKFYRYLVIS